MLAFAVRGIVLLSVLSWYSATVWKMIDGYFKDQFRGYLQDEYRKHPQMKSDIESSRIIVDKGSNPIYDSHMTCPSDIIDDACQQTTIQVSNGKSTEQIMTSGVGENATDINSTDKNAFSKNASRSELESGKSSSGVDADDKERQPSVIDQNGNREKDTIEKSFASSSRRLIPKKRLSRASKEEISKKEISREKAKKRRINTIVLTEADFAGARIKNEADDDFSEFEEEEGRKIREEGILVSELPFIPKADIGELDRVNAEEFCPLTLEDEDSCGEISTWP